MAQESFKVSAPGKLMLLGEHAVLHGRRALVGAVNQRIAVTCKPRKDGKIHIISALGEYSTWLDYIEIVPAFRFILAALQQEREHLSCGMDLQVEAEFSADVGLGSSAAVTAAMMGVLYTISRRKVEPARIFPAAMQTIQAVQGCGSGADLAACVYGGILCYQQEPAQVQKINKDFPLTVVYSGSKLQTGKVINMVKEKYTRHPDLFSGIYDLMDKSVCAAAAAIEKADYQELGELFNINQGLMDALGVSNYLLSEINYRLRKEPGISGSKISGSGLGDCVIGVGKQFDAGFPWQMLPLEFSATGLSID